MEKLVICKINVEINVEAQPVVSSTEFMPWFSDFISDIKSTAAELGYYVPAMDPAPSLMNGRISRYYTFSLQGDEYKLKAVMGIRFSNHTSKLSESKHKDIIRKEENLDDTVDVGYFDVVQPSDVAYVHITVDGTIVRNEAVALQIIEQKLIAFRDKER